MGSFSLPWQLLFGDVLHKQVRITKKNLMGFLQLALIDGLKWFLLDSYVLGSSLGVFFLGFVFTWGNIVHFSFIKCSRQY